MPIEINGSLTPKAKQAGDSGSPLRIVSDTPASSRQTDDKTVSNDRIDLSGVASLIQRLDARISALPVVDMVRVSTIRQSIEDGSYQPDPLRVADKLIDREIALYGRQRDGAAG